MSKISKKYTILVCLLALLANLHAIDKASASRVNKEVMISLNYGQQLKESWTNGIEVHYFGEPNIGVEIVYNLHGRRERHEVLDIIEELRLEEHSIGFLYRPFSFENLVAKFGFKDFNLQYKETAHGDFFSPVTQTTDSIAVISWRDRISGLWFELSGNKELPLLGKRIKVFGEAGVTLAKEKRFVVVDGVKESNWQILPEFGCGLALKVISPFKIKLGYYQTNLKNIDNFYFIGPAAKNLRLGELRASLEVTYR
jgi:hypothetical protein